jgi:hypothetical protein
MQRAHSIRGEMMSEVREFEDLDLREEPPQHGRTPAEQFSNQPTCRTTPCTATYTIGCCV